MAGATRASYKIVWVARVSPSCCAHQASNVDSATDPAPGTQALEVSMTLAPVLTAFWVSVSIRPGPPIPGVQCSVSSPTTKDTSAPSAVPSEEVICSSLPPPGASTKVLPTCRPYFLARGERLDAMARTMRMVLAVCLSLVAAICTSGIDTGLPTHPPGASGSKWSKRTGPSSSVSESTPANGLLPEPFARRRTALLCSHRPSGSRA